MLQCPKCDEPVNRQCRFCPHCGLPLADDAHPDATLLGAPGDVVQSESPDRRWLLYGGAAAALLVALIGIFSLASSSSRSSTARPAALRPMRPPVALYGSSIGHAGRSAFTPQAVTLPRPPSPAPMTAAPMTSTRTT